MVRCIHNNFTVFIINPCSRFSLRDNVTQLKKEAYRKTCDLMYHYGLWHVADIGDNRSAIVAIMNPKLLMLFKVITARKKKQLGWFIVVLNFWYLTSPMD